MIIFPSIFFPISSIGLHKIRSFSQLAAVVYGPCIWIQAARPPVSKDVEASNTSSNRHSSGPSSGGFWPSRAPVMPRSSSLGSKVFFLVAIITPGIPGWSIEIIPIFAETNLSRLSCRAKRAKSATR